MFSSSITIFIWHSWNVSRKLNAAKDFRCLLTKVQIYDLTWICSWECAQKNLTCAFIFSLFFPAQFRSYVFMSHPLISKLQSFHHLSISGNSIWNVSLLAICAETQGGKRSGYGCQTWTGMAPVLCRVFTRQVLLLMLSFPMKFDNIINLISETRPPKRSPWTLKKYFN